MRQQRAAGSTTSSATRRSSTPRCRSSSWPASSTRCRVDVFAFGITADFRTALFPGSQRLIELADRVQVLQVEALCWCGERATHNARTVDGVMVVEGEQVVVGDTDAGGARHRRVRGAVPPAPHAPDDLARGPRGGGVAGGAAVRPRPVPGAGASPVDATG